MSVTATVLSRRDLGGGLKSVRISLLLDNAYPVAGYSLTASLFGLSYFEPNKAGTALLDPVVNRVSGAIVLARVSALKLLLSYPSGGGAASPTTIASPGVVTTPDAGATTMTGSAAKPALAGVVTPGSGKDFADASDASAVTVILTATGF